MLRKRRIALGIDEMASGRCKFAGEGFYASGLCSGALLALSPETTVEDNVS